MRKERVAESSCKVGMTAGCGIKSEYQADKTDIKLAQPQVIRGW
jgi:hypothetical protein